MYLEAKRLLKEIYGYDGFRPGQASIIKSVLERKNTLGVMPTGGGKSVCYQIPALLFKGLTIVVSPLISLMKDQVDALKILGVPASFINSSLEKENFAKVYRELRNGNTKILYVSPERLNSDSFINLMENIEISLIAVDEAHCISMWGNDFRKSYLEIPKFTEKLNRDIQILALTATATLDVREDIISKLQMNDAKIFVNSFDRSNIFLDVKEFSDDDGINEFIKKYIRARENRSGIIYCSTRKEVDSLSAYLNTVAKIKCVKYHAGMEDFDKKEAQELFSKDEVKIIVATNAFGMGIDKSNVRWVLHRNLPKDIESYYQEIGRVGRDGADGEALLIYVPSDEGTQKFFIDDSRELSDELKYVKSKKLEKMVDYCHLSSCYREYILKYFGDRRIKDYCGFCKNCKKEKNVEVLTIEAQKIFSCIGRAKHIGVSTLVNILLGKSETKIEKNGYNQLSTFGIMKEVDREWLNNFINYLISENYLSHSAGSYPILTLERKAYDVLKNLKPVKRKKNERVSFDYYSDENFQKLLELRQSIARDEGVAPYLIFSDNTLMEIADKLPQNRGEFLKIKGIGNQKYINYGERFLSIIHVYDEETFYSVESLENIKNILKLQLSLKELDTILKNNLVKR